MSDSDVKHWETLQALARQVMEKNEVPGVALGLLYQDAISSAGLGVTSVEYPQPVSGRTLFQIGSITKTFTGAILMQLVEENKLDLDAPVRRYLADFQVSDQGVTENVTTRHLLTHTAGWAGDHFVNTGEGADALGKYVAGMADLPQISPLGAHFSYNNAGYYLAGRLVEQLIEKPYEEILRERLLEPLGMDQAFLYAGDVLTHSFAVGHLNGDDGPKVARPWALPRAVHPVGGLVTDVETLLLYARFQMGAGSMVAGERILAHETLAAMHAPLVEIRPGESWGLSWKIWEVDGVRLISHGGGTLGQVSNLTIAPARGFAFAILTNADHGSFVTNALTRQAVKSYLDLELPRPEPLDVSTDELAAYAGRYARPWAEIELGVLADRLVGQLVYKGGFPDQDCPPAPPPPPMTLALCAPDRLVVLDGAFKDGIVDVVRKDDGSIGWLRFSLRLHALQK
jgi:CubicO group peptidase (beta-lactamase class C family)